MTGHKIALQKHSFEDRQPFLCGESLLSELWIIKTISLPYKSQTLRTRPKGSCPCTGETMEKSLNKGPKERLAEQKSLSILPTLFGLMNCATSLCKPCPYSEGEQWLAGLPGLPLTPTSQATVIQHETSCSGADTSAGRWCSDRELPALTAGEKWEGSAPAALAEGSTLHRAGQ